MNISKLEALPTELWLLIFDYLTSFDLFKAFFGIKNKRIEYIMMSRSLVLNTTLMSHAQMNNMFTLPNFFTLLHTIILDNSCSSLAFYDYWTTMTSPTYWTPLIERLIVMETEYYSSTIVSSLIKSLLLGNTLQYLHLVFEYPNDRYMVILTTLVKTQTSIHSTILEVKKGHEIHTKEICWNLYEIEILFWPRTVQLTLSIQYPFELIIILQNGAIPNLEHLNVTIEREEFEEKPYLKKPQPYIQLCEHDICQTTDATRLQTLVLRHLALSQLIILLDSFSMPSLNKLTLVDIFDETLAHLDEFRRVVGYDHLPSLKDLNFLICFPENLYETLKTHLIAYGNTWPFNNVDYHLDEKVISGRLEYKIITKTVLLFYTCPFDILLQHTRTIHNHSFTKHSNVIQQQSIEWTCDKMDSFNQMGTTLYKLTGGYLDTLHLHYYEMKTPIQINETVPSPSILWRSQLRSVTFAFDSASITRWQRSYFIDQILDISPRLSHLVVAWDDFRYCSRPNTNVKHVHLVLHYHYNKPNKHIHVSRLFKLVPGISCLETGGGNIMFNENLVEFVLKIINIFHQLVELTLNKEGYCPIKPEIQLAIQQAIFAASSKRLLTSDTCQITFPKRNKLRIWL